LNQMRLQQAEYREIDVNSNFLATESGESAESAESAESGVFTLSKTGDEMNPCSVQSLTMQIKYFDELAGIVANIDQLKNNCEEMVLVQVGHGIRLIARMRFEMFDTGSLQEIFSGIRDKYRSAETMPDLIDTAHEEIAYLLGEHSWRIYGHDDKAAA
jgi:hypothetical protein